MKPRPSLKPYFELVTVRVCDIGKGITRRELAAAPQPAAGALDFLNGRVNVAGRSQAESEMNDAAAFARVREGLIKGNDILATGCANMNTAFFPKIGFNAEDLVVKSQRAFHIANGQGEVRQSERWNHIRVLSSSRSERQPLSLTHFDNR